MIRQSGWPVGLSIVWLLRQMAILSREYTGLGVLLLYFMIALASFLMAGTRHAYSPEFNYLWILFLPIGLAHIGLLREKGVNFVREASRLHA